MLYGLLSFCFTDVDVCFIYRERKMQ